MAVNINPGAYSEFSERLQNPYTNFAIQLQLKKKAQEDAMDQYYLKLNESLNPAGVRYVDMPDFQKRVEALKTYTIQNRDKLRRGDIPSQLERQRLFRDAENIIAGSKEAAKRSKDAAAVGLKLRDENKNLEPFFGELSKNEVALTDPNFQMFDPQRYLMQPKPLDENVYFDKFSKTPRVSEFAMGKVDPKSGYRIDTETKYFTPEVKQGLATQFAQDFHDNWSFNDRIREILKDPNEKQNLANFFKEQFGVSPDSPEDYAAAYGIRRLQPKITQEGKPVRDEKWMLDYKQGQEKQMKQWEHALSQMDEIKKNAWLKDYLTMEGDKARTDEFGNKKGMSVYNLGGGVSYAGNEIPLTAFLTKALTKNNQAPYKLIVSDAQVKGQDGQYRLDRKYIPLYHEIGDDKKKTGQIDRTLSVPQDIDQFVIDAGGQVGVKQKNIEGASIVGKEPETKKTTKVYSYKGKQYSPEQIEAAAKQSGMTVDEYLKKSGIK